MIINVQERQGVSHIIAFSTLKFNITLNVNLKLQSVVIRALYHYHDYQVISHLSTIFHHIRLYRTGSPQESKDYQQLSILPKVCKWDCQLCYLGYQIFRDVAQMTIS